MSVRGVPGEVKKGLGRTLSWRRGAETSPDLGEWSALRQGDPSDCLLRTIFDNIEPELEIVYPTGHAPADRSLAPASTAALPPQIPRTQPHALIFTSSDPRDAQSSLSQRLPIGKRGKLTRLRRSESNAAGGDRRTIEVGALSLASQPVQTHSYDSLPGTRKLHESTRRRGSLSPEQLQRVERGTRSPDPEEIDVGRLLGADLGVTAKDRIVRRAQTTGVQLAPLSDDMGLLQPPPQNGHHRRSHSVEPTSPLSDASQVLSTASPFATSSSVAGDASSVSPFQLDSSPETIPRAPEHRRKAAHGEGAKMDGELSDFDLCIEPISTRPRSVSAASSPSIEEYSGSGTLRRRSKVRRAPTVIERFTDIAPDGSPAGEEAAARPAHLTAAQLRVRRPRSPRASHDPDAPYAPIFTLFDDAPPSAETVSMSARAKQWIEEYYWELLSYMNQRHERQKHLQQKLGELDHQYEREAVISQFAAEEHAMLRSRRLCGRLGDFEFLKRIGKGAFGEVYLCKHKRTKEVLALKRISKRNLHVKNQVAAISAERDVLRSATTDSISTAFAESETCWITRLMYAFQDSVHIYFGMEFVPGGDFSTFLSNVGELEEDQARLYSAEMFVAVNFLHKLGYIHRDLKPDNFLIDASGHLKLADFGLSKKGVEETVAEPFTSQLPALPHIRQEGPVVKPRPRRQSRDALVRKEAWRATTRAGKRKKAYSMVGSPDYMAVEILRNQGYGFAADWWSLACILYEQLCGFPPFSAETPREVFENIIAYEEVLENPRYLDDDGVEHELLSPNAWSFVKAVIVEPDRRLGRDGMGSIRRHPFFEGLDWSNLRAETPDFVPKLSSPEDTSYFDGAVDVKSIPVEGEDGIEVPSFREKMKDIDQELHSVVSKDALSVRSTPSISSSILNASEYAGNERIRRMSSADETVDALQGKKVTRMHSLKNLLSGIRPRKIYSRGAFKDETESRVSLNTSIESLSPALRAPGSAPRNLSSLPMHDWRILCTGARIIRLPKNTVVIQQGRSNTKLFRIKSGSVRVRKTVLQTGAGKTHIDLTVLGRNAAFGEMSFVEDFSAYEDDLTAASASVLVDEDHTELYVIKRSFVFGLFRVDPGLFARFFRCIAGTLALRAASLPLQHKLHELHQHNEPQVERSAAVAIDVSPRHSALFHGAGADVPPETPNRQKLMRDDERFRKKFPSLPPDEALVRELDVIVLEQSSSRDAGTKRVKKFGKLFVGNTHMVLKLKMFGSAQKYVIPYKDVLNIGPPSRPVEPARHTRPRTNSRDGRSSFDVLRETQRPRSGSFGSATATRGSGFGSDRSLDSPKSARVVHRSLSTGSTEEEEELVSIVYVDEEGNSTRSFVLQIDRSNRPTSRVRSYSTESPNSANGSDSFRDPDLELLSNLVESVQRAGVNAPETPPLKVSSTGEVSLAFTPPQRHKDGKHRKKWHSRKSSKSATTRKSEKSVEAPSDSSQPGSSSPSSNISRKSTSSSSRPPRPYRSDKGTTKRSSGRKHRSSKDKAEGRRKTTNARSSASEDSLARSEEDDDEFRSTARPSDRSLQDVNGSVSLAKRRPVGRAVVSSRSDTLHLSRRIDFDSPDSPGSPDTGVLKKETTSSGDEFLRMSFGDATKERRDPASEETGRHQHRRGPSYSGRGSRESDRLEATGRRVSDPERELEIQYAAELRLTQDDWTTILDNAAECTTYHRNQVILRQGAESDCVYQVANGLVRVEHRDPDACASHDGSGSTSVGTLKQGDMFGEVAFLEPGVGSLATCTALSDRVAVYSISRELLLQVFDTEPALAGRFFKYLALMLSRRVRLAEQERADEELTHVHNVV